MSERIDDDEPIQADWLVDKFGQPQRSMTNEAVWTIGHRNVVLVADMRGLFAKSGSNTLVELETRGQVRLLCEAIDVPLKQ